jgi:hypothetical protein
MRCSYRLRYDLCRGSVRRPIREYSEARYAPSSIDTKRVVNGSTAVCNEPLGRQGWRAVDNLRQSLAVFRAG